MTNFLGLGISVSNEGPVEETVALAQKAEELGFDEVSIPESRLFRSVTTTAAAVLSRTDRITVRIGIANPVTRHPLLLALEAATLADLGPGRIRFGLGAAEWTVKELGIDPAGWRPYTNTVESLRAMRSLLAGRSLGFTPTTFISSSEATLDCPVPRNIPIDIGAVNTRMLEAAGAHADGVQLGAITSVGYTHWAAEQIKQSATNAGRDHAEILISANVLTSVDPDRQVARNAVREVLAYYLSRVEGVVIEESGADTDDIDQVRQAFTRGGLAAGASAVSEHLIDTFSVAGTPNEVVKGLAPYADAGLQMPLVWHTFGPNSMDALSTIAKEIRPGLW
jgi:5,10-methylenetetrahydromethanopterin reductase